MENVKVKVFTLERWIKSHDWLGRLNASSGPVLQPLLATTNGCFDILHIGHIRCLREASEQTDFLMVLVNDDDSVRRLKGYPRPIVPCKERMEVLAALGRVKWVIPFSEDTPVETLERMYEAGLGPTVHVKGASYKTHHSSKAGFVGLDAIEPMPEAKVVTEHGGRIHFTELVPNVSTTALIERIRKLHSEEDTS